MGAPEKKEATTFGGIALELKFVTIQDLKECIDIQLKMKAMGVPPKKLGQLMVEKGYLTEDQVRLIFKIQGIRGGHTQIAGYRMLAQIGEGAMGSVHKAVQISMDRPVAIKILAPRYAENSRFVEMFFREARAVAKLSHPNIIQGIDVGESNGVHYFAMEYLDGSTVGDLLKRGGALDEKRALNIVIQIARALEHANKNGMVHRDVKPDNIMVTRAGMAKLCDLGLAKLPTQQQKAERVAMGTPNYISPEQARGDADVDIRSDIYSLGASFYHMVVGDVPFRSDSAAQVIAMHLNDPLVPPLDRNPLVSEEVNYMIVRMMEKDRNQRYQNPADLLLDLEAVADGKGPVSIPAAVEVPGPRRPVGRHIGHYRRRLRR
jgi:serine/threonine protein kinase